MIINFNKCHLIYQNQISKYPIKPSGIYRLNKNDNNHKNKVQEIHREIKEEQNQGKFIGETG